VCSGRSRALRVRAGFPRPLDTREIRPPERLPTHATRWRPVIVIAVLPAGCGSHHKVHSARTGPAVTKTFTARAVPPTAMSACRRHWRLDHGRHHRRSPRPPKGRRPLRRSRAQRVSVPSTKAELRPRSRSVTACAAVQRAVTLRIRIDLEGEAAVPARTLAASSAARRLLGDRIVQRDKPLAPRNLRPADQPWASSEVKIHVGGDQANRRDKGT